MKAAESGSFLRPSMKLILNYLPLESKELQGNGVCHHAMSINNKEWHPQ